MSAAHARRGGPRPVHLRRRQDAALQQFGDDRQPLLGRPPGARWTDADVPLLEEAASPVDGPPEHVFGHIVDDEAQELTARQWRMTVRRCPGRSMPLVGDFAQAGPATVAQDRTEALRPHLDRPFDLRTLTVGHRTTVDPDGIVAARPCGERDLYVALTRATKRLCTVTVPKAAGITTPG